MKTLLHTVKFRTDLESKITYIRFKNMPNTKHKARGKFYGKVSHL